MLLNALQHKESVAVIELKKKGMSVLFDSLVIKAAKSFIDGLDTDKTEVKLCEVCYFSPLISLLYKR